jgi:hypothetical protein
MRAGDSPRTRFVLRLIAIECSLRGVFLFAAGTYSLLIPFELYRTRDPPQPLEGWSLVNVLIVLYLASTLRRRLAVREALTARPCSWCTGRASRSVIPRAARISRARSVQTFAGCEISSTSWPAFLSFTS